MAKGIAVKVFSELDLAAVAAAVAQMKGIWGKAGSEISGNMAKETAALRNLEREMVDSANRAANAQIAADKRRAEAMLANRREEAAQAKKITDRTAADQRAILMAPIAGARAGQAATEAEQQSKRAADAADAHTAALERNATAASAAGVAWNRAGMAITGGLAVGLGESLKQATKFEEQTTQVGAALGETTQQINQTQTALLQLAPQVGRSLNQLSEASLIVGKMGWKDAADNIRIVGAASQLASVEGAPLIDVVKTLATSMKDFNFALGDTPKVASMLRAAIGDAGTTMADYTGAMHTLQSTFQLFASGKDAQTTLSFFSQMNALLAQGTKNGTSADQTAQQLVNTIQHMITLQPKQQAMIDQLAAQAPAGSPYRNFTGQAYREEANTKGPMFAARDLMGLIRSQVGPDGQHIVMDAMRESADLQATMKLQMANLSPELQGVAGSVVHGKPDLKQLRLARMSSGAFAEWLNNFKKASGFDPEMNKFTGALMPGTQMTIPEALKEVTGTQFGFMQMSQAFGTDQKSNSTMQIYKDQMNAKPEGNNVEGWSKVAETAGVKIKQLNAELQEIAVTVGTKLLPAFKGALDGVRGFFDFLASHQALLQGFVHIMETVAEIWVGSKIITGVRTMVNVYGDLYKSMTKVAEQSTITATAVATTGNAAGTAAPKVQTLKVADEELSGAEKIAAVNAGTLATEEVAAGTAAEASASKLGIFTRAAGLLGRTLPVIGAALLMGQEADKQLFHTPQRQNSPFGQMPLGQGGQNMLNQLGIHPPGGSPGGDFWNPSGKPHPLPPGAIPGFSDTTLTPPGSGLPDIPGLPPDSETQINPNDYPDVAGGGGGGGGRGRGQGLQDRLSDVNQQIADLTGGGPVGDMGVAGQGGVPDFNALYNTAYGLLGTPYGQGGIDCSGLVTASVNAMLGNPGMADRLTTANAESWLPSHGFVMGSPPGPGYMTVGWYDHGGGQNGHMAMTLPDGTNMEQGGSTGGKATAGGVGAFDSQFDHLAYYPIPMTSTGDLYGGMGATPSRGGLGNKNGTTLGGGFPPEFGGNMLEGMGGSKKGIMGKGGVLGSLAGGLTFFLAQLAMGNPLGHMMNGEVSPYAWWSGGGKGGEGGPNGNMNNMSSAQIRASMSANKLAEALDHLKEVAKKHGPGTPEYDAAERGVENAEGRGVLGDRSKQEKLSRLQRTKSELEGQLGGGGGPGATWRTNLDGSQTELKPDGNATGGYKPPPRETSVNPTSPTRSGLGAGPGPGGGGILGGMGGPMGGPGPLAPLDLGGGLGGGPGVPRPGGAPSGFMNRTGGVNQSIGGFNTGASKPGFGISGLLSDTLGSAIGAASMGADAFAPGSGAAVSAVGQLVMQEANRAAQTAGEVAADLIGELPIETFFLSGKDLSGKNVSPSNNFIGKLVGGLMGAHTNTPNSAGGSGQDPTKTNPNATPQDPNDPTKTNPAQQKNAGQGAPNSQGANGGNGNNYGVQTGDIHMAPGQDPNNLTTNLNQMMMAAPGGSAVGRS